MCTEARVDLWKWHDVVALPMATDQSVWVAAFTPACEHTLSTPFTPYLTPTARRQRRTVHRGNGGGQQSPHSPHLSHPFPPYPTAAKAKPSHSIRPRRWWWTAIAPHILTPLYPLPDGGKGEADARSALGALEADNNSLMEGLAEAEALAIAAQVRG